MLYEEWWQVTSLTLQVAPSAICCILEKAIQKRQPLILRTAKTLSVIFHSPFSVPHFLIFPLFFPLSLIPGLKWKHWNNECHNMQSTITHGSLFSQHFSKYYYTFPFIPGCVQLKCNLLSCSPLGPICCWVAKLLRKRSVNLLSKPQAEGLHSSLSTQRAVYLHPCTPSPWQPQPNTLACSTLFNFFLPFLISSLGSHAHSH